MSRSTEHIGRRLSRGARFLALAWAGAVALAVLPAGAAHAVAPEKVAWWWKIQQAPPPVVIPSPNVPEGGIMVAQDPSGVLAYGAYNYQVAPGSTATLVIKTNTGSVATGANIAGCATVNGWNTQAGAGSWFSKPDYSATGCIPGVVPADGMSVTFAFGPDFTSSGLLDVAIVPGAGATAFSVTFGPVAADALTTAGGETGTTVVDPPPVTDPTTPVVTDPGTGGATPSGPVTDFGSGSGTGSRTIDLNSGTSGGATSAGSGSAAPASAGARSGSSSASSGTPKTGTITRRAVAVAKVSDQRGQRLMAFLVLCAILSAWWWVGGQTARAPRLLGSSAAGDGSAPAVGADAVNQANDGGIGRFTRPRTLRPKRL